jgi:hypothetical protein
MLLKNIPLLLAAIAASAQAFTVSPDAADGIYVVSTDASGNENHTKIADPTPTEALTAKRNLLNVHVKRGVCDTNTCGDAAELSHPNTDAANADLGVQCGGGGGVFVPGGHNWYSKRGGTVAFFCNFGEDNRCDSGSRQVASGYITAACSLYKAGWAGPSGGCLNYRCDHVDSQFCGHGA